MPARKIGDLLHQSSELRALSRRAEHLAELQRAMLEAIPRPLSHAYRIRNFRSGTLLVAADNAAAAAKLRHLAPRLLEHLRKRDEQVTKIQIEVQVAMQQIRPGKRSRKTPLNARVIGDFQRLVDTLKESPLRLAVTRLVQRHKQSVK
jgi:hypothetical protein